MTPGAPQSFRAGYDPRRFQALPDTERYDAVIATVPSDVFLQLLEPALADAIGAESRLRLHETEYHTAQCMLLEVDRPLTPFYWTNAIDRDMPFVGVIEQTNFADPERYGGRRFMYVANYFSAGHPMLSKSMAEVTDIYERGLKRINPEFSKDWIKQQWLFREPAAQPIVTIGYRERMPPMQTGVPGLLVANTTQIYPEDRGTNYSVRLGDAAVRALLADPVAAAAAATV